MTRCDNEGATHHTGCECHEARRDAEIERLKAEVTRLMITNNDCNRAIDWAKNEMNKLRDVVRQVHAMTGRGVDWAAFPGVAATALVEIHKLTKEEP